MHMGVFEWCLDDYAPYQSGKATDPVFFDNSKNLKKVARGGDSGYFMHPKIHNKKLEDPIKIRRYVRSASRGRFGPGIPYPIVGFRPVLAPAINIPVPKIPEDELVVPVE
jgi:formylglycine-generating enzyme required for sulfatase activity